MRPKTAVLVASVLAVVVAAPVIVLVALGTYGSAAGLQRSTGESRAQLSLEPPRGAPGSVVTVRGRDWPAKREILLFIRRPTVGGSDLKTRLATAITSRNGAFAVEFVIPQTLIGPDTQRVLIEAEEASLRQFSRVSDPAVFELEPHPNVVTVSAMDGQSGEPLPGAIVEVKDSLGKSVASAMTGPGGAVRLTGVAPGSSTVVVRLRDYLSGQANLTVPESGRAELVVELAHRPNRRLYLAFLDLDGLSGIKVAGVDRSSGLRADLTVDVPPFQWRTPGTSAQPSSHGSNFQFRIAGDPAPSSPEFANGASDQLVASFKFLRNSGISVTHRGRLLDRAVWYLGRTAAGELAMLVETDVRSTFADLVTVDPESGRSRLISRGLSVFDVAPVMSNDGSRFYILRRGAGRIDAVDSDSGAVVAQFRDLPRYVLRVVDAPNEASLYLLTGLGELYVADLHTGALEGPIATIPGATNFAIGGDGRSIFVVGMRLQYVVVLDINDPTSKRLAPLPEGAYWVWADPDGPFLLAGPSAQPSVTVIDAHTLEIAGRLDLRSASDLQP